MRYFPSFQLVLSGILLFALTELDAASQTTTDDLVPIRAWIAKQAQVRSVSARFTQTRALRTLRSPIKTEGQLWFKAPEWFRWELGDPAKTIVLGTPDGVTVIHPAARRAERKPMDKAGATPDAALGMMRFPGGGSMEDFVREVQVLSVRTVGSQCHVEMLPRDAQAARRLSVIKWAFDMDSGHWISLEIITREGSSIRNDFYDVETNGKIDKGVFTFDLSGFRISDE